MSTEQILQNRFPAESVQEQLRRLEEARQIAAECCPNVKFPNISREPLYYGRRDHVKVDGRQILVDKDSETWYGIVSDQYKLVRHEEVVAKCYMALKEYEDALGVPKIEVRLPYDGAKLIVVGTFPDAKKDDVKVGDPICPKIDFRSSYDQSWQLSGQIGMLRLACSNGMTTFSKWQSFVKRHHVSPLPDLSIIDEVISAAKPAFDQEIERLKVWANIKITEELYNNVWELLPFSANEKEKIEGMPLIGYEGDPTILVKLESDDLTAWDFNNAATQYATHHIESEMRRAEIDPTISRVFTRITKTNGI